MFLRWLLIFALAPLELLRDALTRAGEALLGTVRNVARSTARGVAVTAHSARARVSHWASVTRGHGRRTRRGIESVSGALRGSASRLGEFGRRARVTLAAKRPSAESLRTFARAGAIGAAACLGVALLAMDLVTLAPTPAERTLPPVSAAPEPVAPRPLPTVTPAPSPPPAPRLPVSVHVNARPWARIWIDGADLGATPLRRELPAGTHRLEAEFPDGRRVKRDIEVSPERRFVSLP